MGETRVDLLHLLEDLADAYPGKLEETILTEIVANARDTGAATISINCNPASASFNVVDNGRGMRRIQRIELLSATLSLANHRCRD